MKKKTAFCILIAMVIVGISVAIYHSKSIYYQYEGVILSVTADENGNIILDTQSTLNDAIVKMKMKSNKKIPCDKSGWIAAKDLEIGDIILADFRGKPDGDCYRVKRAKILPRYFHFAQS